MAILSSVNVIFFRISFLFFLAFLCLKNVRLILDHSFVLLLTQAMNLPILTLSPHSGQLGLFSLLFAFQGINDLIPLIERNIVYFESLVPFRLMLFFMIVMCSYVFENNLYLHNNCVFIYACSEIWINLLIFTALREEKLQRLSTTNESEGNVPT